MKRSARSAVALVLGGIVIFVGLPLLGWGPRDAAGFFANPARTLYALATLVLSLWIVLTIPDAGRGRSRGHTTVERQHVAVILLQVLSIAAVIVAPYCDRRGIAVITAREWIRYAGLAAYVGGYVLIAIATATLGRQFSIEVTIQRNHRLVTEGPYGVIRHPRYTGVIALFVGISLLFRSELALLLTLLVTAVLLWRIRDEEGLMKREFGRQWEEYARTTWRFVPYIY